ncbi:MAG: hypothetical protein IPK26_29820 [Planctomycetes bacterium]|nr:hypothetical protein [Planctomycetota bacterium]
MGGSSIYGWAGAAILTHCNGLQIDGQLRLPNNSLIQSEHTDIQRQRRDPPRWSVDLHLYRLIVDRAQPDHPCRVELRRLPVDGRLIFQGPAVTDVQGTTVYLRAAPPGAMRGIIESTTAQTCDISCGSFVNAGSIQQIYGGCASPARGRTGAVSCVLGHMFLGGTFTLANLESWDSGRFGRSG